jgi:hypothetical protein
MADDKASNNKEKECDDSKKNGSNVKMERFNRRMERKEKRLELRQERKKAKYKWLEKRAGLPHQKAFFLVFWMLVSLTLLVIGIAGLPLLIQSLTKQSVTTAESTKIIFFDSEMFAKVLDYSKWVLSALLAAFGAWIGAGAAYFFSKESLQESSRATEAALEIQQKTLGAKPGAKTFVKDLALTAMNPSFMFNTSKTLDQIMTELEKRVGYWFVPFIDESSGKLEDVVSSQVFWTFKYDRPKKFKPEDEVKPTIKEILDFLGLEEADEKLKKLHGLNTFFIKIKLEDTLESVAAQMKSPNIAVAIVVDEKGKPTHCVTRTDIGSLLKPEG